MQRSFGPPHVLAVDDDPIMRDLLRLHLTNAGYDVTLAEDGIEAGKALLQSVPDLLLVDVDMPYMNGFELVTALKDDPDFRDIPVVFLTAHVDAEKYAEQVGALRCLRKPIFASQLISAVAAIVPPQPPAEATSPRTSIASLVSGLVGAPR